MQMHSKKEMVQIKQIIQIFLGDKKTEEKKKRGLLLRGQLSPGCDEEKLISWNRGEVLMGVKAPTWELQRVCLGTKMNVIRKKKKKERSAAKNK